MSKQGVNHTNLRRRVTDVEADVEELKAFLNKGVYVMQRIQWTLTGLVIYYVLDSFGAKEIIKLVLKGLL